MFMLGRGTKQEGNDPGIWLMVHLISSRCSLSRCQRVLQIPLTIRHHLHLSSLTRRSSPDLWQWLFATFASRVCALSSSSDDDDDDDDDDGDVGLNVLECRADILGTNCKDSLLHYFLSLYTSFRCRRMCQSSEAV